MTASRWIRKRTHQLNTFKWVVDPDIKPKSTKVCCDKIGESSFARGPIAVTKYDICARNACPSLPHLAADRIHRMAIDVITISMVAV